MIVHLIRHGQTVGYAADLGLTPTGISQAEARGIALHRSLPEGAQVEIGYAPTERTRQTAAVLHSALSQDQKLHVEEPLRLPEYRNLQVTVDGVERDPTQVRVEAETAGHRGWAIEARRFWQAHERGDAMGFWLTTPLLSHESPSDVVKRFLSAVAARNSSAHLVVATHSGCLRAIVAWAWGRDPGEPDNAEEVTLTVGDDTVEVTHRGVAVSLELPAPYGMAI